MQRFPSARAALVVFVVAALLNFIVTLVMFLFSRNLGIALSEILAVLLPTLAAARILGVDFAATFRWQAPLAVDLVLALPLAVSLSVVNDQLSNLTGLVYPMPVELQRAIAELLRASTPLDWIVRILGVGIGAAVAEECLFRGFIQNGLEERLGRWGSVAVTSALFALMHFLPSGAPGYFLAGIVLSVVAMATGSLAVPIAVHCANNVGVVALLNLAKVETLGRPLWTPVEILVPSLLVFTLIMRYYALRLRTRVASPARAGHVA